MPSMGNMRSPRREAASARKKRHQELAAERRQHKERAAAARRATAGGGAGALVARFRRRVATFDKTRSGDFEHRGPRLCDELDGLGAARRFC